MHANRRDLTRAREPDIGPCAALIRAAIDAVTVARTLSADRLFAGADVHHIRVGCRDGDGTDRPDPEPAVRDIPPVDAGIVRAPQTAAGVAREVGERHRWNAGSRVGATASEWSDVPPLQCAEGRGVDRTRRRGRCGRRRPPLRTDRQRGADSGDQHDVRSEETAVQSGHRRAGGRLAAVGERAFSAGEINRRTVVRRGPAGGYRDR